MYKDVTIGSKTVGMAANALSPYLFKQVFRSDFLKEIQKPEPDEDLFVKMGFIFAKQAEVTELSKLTKLNETDFFKWLQDFEPLDVMVATGEISGLYYTQSESSSVPKNEAG